LTDVLHRAPCIISVPSVLWSAEYLLVPEHHQLHDHVSIMGLTPGPPTWQACSADCLMLLLLLRRFAGLKTADGWSHWKKWCWRLTVRR